MIQIPIALQLYTVRNTAETDLTETLSQITKFGYKNVELAGLYGLASSEIKILLEDFGLKAVSAHVGIEGLEGDNLGETIKTYQDLGVESIVVPFVSDEIRHVENGYVKLSERLNNAGELLSKYGFSLAYHNHNFEFGETVDGEPAIKTLIANTDPALVSFEFDTYWALFAGFDPVEFITKHGPRISLLHIKDMDAADRSFAPIGTGTLPLDEIITASVTAGVRYLIVEQDTTKGPELDAVKISYDNLKAKGYV